MAKVTRGKPQVELIDPSMLSEEEMHAIRARAKKTVDEEIKQRTADRFYEDALKAERRKADPQEEIKFIRLDLAGHSDRIMLDGTVYFHGHMYEVPLSVFNVLREVVANGWKHEDEVGGANRDTYHKPREMRISPRNPQGVSAFAGAARR